jgi:hypothetical protein
MVSLASTESWILVSSSGLERLCEEAYSGGFTARSSGRGVGRGSSIGFGGHGVRCLCGRYVDDLGGLYGC